MNLLIDDYQLDSDCKKLKCLPDSEPRKRHSGKVVDCRQLTVIWRDILGPVINQNKAAVIKQG